MMEVEERSTVFLDVSFYDQNNQPVVPTSIYYQVHDYSSGLELKAETSINPASIITIEIGPEENRIVNPNKRFEERVVTIRALFGSRQKTKEYRYRVVNLSYI